MGNVDTEARTELVRAGAVVAGAGLADAFGHVSVRTDRGMLITGPTPLDRQSVSSCVEIDLDTDELPTGVPKEAWIHLGIARADEQTSAICRAQPRNVAKAIAAGRTIKALDGHGALLGTEVPVHHDSRLVRDAEQGIRVAEDLGDSPAIVLRGNGAVTTGATVAAAVARMWLLDRSAELALAAPDGAVLSEEEQQWWRGIGDELLPRIYRYLLQNHPVDIAPE